MARLTISVPTDLEADLEDRVADTEFMSLEEYVLFVLREVAEGDDRQEDERDLGTDGVEKRLEELGYL